ncbi:VOC family protein [Bacillus sp. FSL K6-3431]|uniref:VOC family protein n=1 Tax=Bacillus sp. FSL K6-3431 TaxID=2921500 RepID=UPI0030F5D92C
MSIYLNLVVIQSSNPVKSVSFYEKLGLVFNQEKHGKGPEHYACKLDKLIFEIYPTSKEGTSNMMRIGFTVIHLDEIMESIRSSDAYIITEPTISPWGKRAVVQDPDGYKVELIEPLDI